ncbi:3-hydroxyisobutyrate dehydrogenase [Reticulibacter mediterranei]|uniref:3-hydroxyisobutyrate dehydrogenase n=1 Tax=Reticulibacter mediterranei TaxID=2778369 RepID=A0A8J3N6K3_9CHLR|nr:NAD(P)-dependent oxidoreductase [Reticulibacter mediterranei]GHO97658.1 3-hydroxyisobutyrate dehydrogenase [Reticulibacter mediterranei]
MSETIGFIGLGLLGKPVARNLLKAGYSLKIYNRTASKVEELLPLGGIQASSLQDVMTTGGIVITVVSDDAALESVVTSEGFLERLGKGGVHLVMSTVAPETSRKMAALHAERGIQYVEAPVFGRPEAAEARQLWVCCAGELAAKERVRPLLEAISQGIFDFGDQIGAANIVKLCGNFLIISAGRSIAEALQMAEKNGVDPKAVVDMLTTTLFSCFIYQSYGARIVANGGVYQSNWIVVKDTGLFEQTAQKVGVPSPLAHSLHEIAVEMLAR